MRKNVLSKKIDKMQSRVDKRTRDYIGASGIGADCLRQIWYEYNGYEAEEVPTKTRRTWNIGKHLEKLILDWLLDAGFEIRDEQIQYCSQELPYFKGHIDAVLMKKGLPFAIIEIKTAKDASFSIFVKKGLKTWNPQYYAQLQSYMGMTNIHQAYMLVLNKDNSDISDELVTFDKEFYQLLIKKAAMIDNAKVAPQKINNSPLWFQCKMCKFNKICHK